MADLPCLNMFMSVVTLMLVCFTYSRCKVVNLYVTVVFERVIGLLARTRYFMMSAGDSPLGVFLVTRSHALDALSQSLFLQQLPLMLTGCYLLSGWATSGYLLRLRICDDVSLPPDVSSLPNVLPGVTSSGGCRLFLLFVRLFSTPLISRAPHVGSHLL